MVPILLHDDKSPISIPGGIESLEEFRRWSRSPRFPSSGRIDFIDGRIEVDMAAEKFFSHGGPKTEIATVLQQIVKREELGEVRTDATRIVCAEANLSAEPDVLFISFNAFDNGRVRLTDADDESRDGAEVRGAPDLVVEVISDSSIAKDTVRLPRSYFAAGVHEYWLVDARGDDLVFKIQTRGRTAFRTVPADAEGFAKSRVFARRFRLTRHTNSRGHWVYDLLVR